MADFYELAQRYRSVPIIHGKKQGEEDILEAPSKLAASKPFAEEESAPQVSPLLEEHALSIRDKMTNDTTTRIVENGGTADDLAKWRAALILAPKVGITPAQAFESYDEIMDSYFVEKPGIKTAPKAIADSFTAAAKMLKLGRAASKMMGSTTGIKEALGEALGYTVDKDALAKEIASLQDEIGALQLDIMPRGWYQSWAKSLAAVIPYTAEIVAVGAVTAGAATLTASSLGIASPTAIAALRSAASMLSRFEDAREMSRGLNYLDLRERGISHEEAKHWADVGAAASSAIESVLSVDAMISGSMGKMGSWSLTESVIRKLGASNFLMAPAAKFAGRVAMGTVSEMIEEGSQSFVEGFSALMAQSAEEQGMVLDPISGRQIFGDIAESVWQAAITAPILGLSGAVAAGISDKKAALDLAGAARHMGKDDFVAVATKSGIFSGPFTSEEAKTSAASDVWEHQRALAEEELIAAKDATKRAARTGEGTEEARSLPRLSDGSVFIQADASLGRDEEGRQGVSYLVGDPSTKSGDALAEVKTLATGDSIIITGGSIDSGIVQVTSEIIAAIAARNPGKEILLGEGVEESALIGGYERYKEEAPTIKPDLALQDSLEEDRLVSELTKYTEADQNEARVATSLLRAFAYAAQGKDKPLSEFTRGLSFESGRKVRSDARNYVSGSFYAPGENGELNAMGKAVDLSKAVITIAKGLQKDLRVETLAHESMHYFRAFLGTVSPDNAGLKELERVYGIGNGIWDAVSEEKFVADLMRYMKQRQGAEGLEPEKIGFLERFADFLRAIYNAIAKELAPGTKAVFDEWFAGYESQDPGTIEVTNPGVLNDAEHDFIKKGKLWDKRVSQWIALASKKSGKSEEYYRDISRRYSVFADHYARALAGNSHPYAKARLSAFRDGSWILSPQLIAETKMRSGEALSQEELALIDLVDASQGRIRLGPLDQTKGEGFDIQNLASTQVLYSTIEEDDNPGRPNAEARYETEAKNYKSLDSWLSSMFANTDTLSDKDRAWFEHVYEYAHKKNGKGNKQYLKKGDFVRYLSAGNNFRDMVANLSQAIFDKRRYQSDESASRAAKLEKAISQAPELSSLVSAYNESGTSPSKAQSRSALSEIRRNESLYKYLYAVLSSDEDLAFEAISELDDVPLLVRRDLTGSGDLSIAEQAAIIAELKDAIAEEDKESLAEKLKNGTLTMDEVKKYLKYKESEYAEAMEDYKKSARGEARMGAREARSAEREKLKEYKRRLSERRALRKLQAEMQRLIDYITTDPGSRVDYYYASLIRGIQEAITAKKPVDPDTLSMLHSFNALYNDEWKAQMDLFIELINEYSGDGSGAMPIEVVKLIAETMKAMSDMGRAQLRHKELQWGLHVKGLRSKILGDITSGKYYLPEVMAETKEAKKREKKLAVRSFEFDALRPDAFFRKYLGKTATGVLFDESMRCRTAKYENYDRRTKPVTDYIAEHGMMTTKKLKRELFLDGIFGNSGPTGITITGSELLGIRLHLGTETEFNESQREALIYGNFFSAEEKNVDGTLPWSGESANEYMRWKYDEKVKKLLAFVNENLTEEEEGLAQVMMGVTDNRGDWYRFASTVVALTNKEPRKERFYFPIFRSGVVSEAEDSIMARLKSYGFAPGLDDGMAIERKKIQPKDQKRIKIDAMQTFFSAISKQEHLIEVGPYVKEITGIFQHGVLAETLSRSIESSLGRKALDYITRQIETLTNPVEFREKATGEDMARFYRGSQVVANLAFRSTSVLMQFLTSPLPGLSEAPLEMFSSSVKAYTNPIGFVRDIEARSPYLKHRQLTPENAILLQRKEAGVATAFEKIALVGMTPLSWADRFSVAIVWDAVYNKELSRLEREGNPEGGSKDELARDYADRFTVKTQPTSDEADRSPMYRDQTVFKQLVLQFTQPLNVIYNNLRMDVPQAVRDQEYMKAIGFVVAYGISGVVLGAIGVLRGRGPDDDDKWTKYWLHAASGQFTDAIPFVGEIVTGLTGTALMGDNNAWLRLDRNLPAVDFLARGIEGLFADEVQVGKVLANTTKGLGQLAGAPVKAIDEAVNIVKALRGEE